MITMPSQTAKVSNPGRGKGEEGMMLQESVNRHVLVHLLTSRVY